MTTDRPTTWSLRRGTLALEGRTAVMGIVNVTPDSFSDGGAFLDPDVAIGHGSRLLREGADIVDVGGESTRPGAEPVSARAELERVEPVVAALSRLGPVSIDTSKAEVAAAAIDAGAVAVNDVTALSDPAMADLIASTGAGIVVMHMKGTPRTMQNDPHYDDVVDEVSAFLQERAAAAIGAGVRPSSVALDPGIGFGKTFEHNLVLLRNLSRLVGSGHPVVLGTSRKRFLGTLTDTADAAERDPATAATVALATAAGVSVVRVHNVAMSLQAARTAAAIVHG